MALQHTATYYTHALHFLTITKRCASRLQDLIRHCYFLLLFVFSLSIFDEVNNIVTTSRGCDTLIFNMVSKFSLTRAFM